MDKHDPRAILFEALVAFANMGDAPEDWRAFGRLWPQFFPTQASGYDRPGFRSTTDWLYTAAELWATLGPDAAETVTTPLLWYRDMVRAVWSNEDPGGVKLGCLLGHISEDDVRKRTCETDWQPRDLLVLRPFVGPGEVTARDTIGGLPKGDRVTDLLTGETGWVFSCQFQQAMHELMSQDMRWRARCCQACGRYFVAVKRAQKYDTTKCAGSMKRKRAREYFHKSGRDRRAARRMIQKDPDHESDLSQEVTPSGG